ncbi:restriction endonuclease subunit S [Aeromonas allosaccharophila]|uniref:restriction endonuclease subunit S n=1 Tax=Aeromonas allosaccharophila TaxID=656 RepID=UPI001BCAEA88|nr:restriction endonuclease subunit S [Aeromonas allosaccharophila]MBS4696717.1 restriction endonuclease subunit S [Aeromonas allosaccharophila]
MVPNGWKLGTIEEISSVSSGGTPSRKNESYWNGNIPWVTTAEVQFKIIEDTAEKITEEGLANSSAKLFPVDTILIAMYGQGKTRGQVAKLGIEASTNQACAAIILKAGYHVDYYYQFLISQYDNIREMANSGGQENLSSGIVKSIKVPVPPLPEQKKIAQILSTWDRAISTTEQLLANSQQQKKALMQQLLTGKKRLLDNNGVRFSRKWESYLLGDWLQEFTKKSVNNDQYEVLTSSRSGLVKQSEYFADSRIAQRDNVGFNIIPPGYITYRSRSDDSLFFFNRNDFPFTGIISTYYPVFNFPDGDTNFFLNLLNRNAAFFSGYSVGTSQKVLSLNALKSVKINLPESEEQQKIAAVLFTADKEITILQQQLDALKQEKKALMQQLLTGKRRVKIN